MKLLAITAIAIAAIATTANGATQAADSTAAAEPALTAFSAHYQAEWKGISVATSDLELKRDAKPGHYVYTWRITARGVFRVVYHDDLIQKSWFSVAAGHVRPLKYSAVDGADTADLDFDWDEGRARGKTEQKLVDLKLTDGTQDVMSIQVEVMLGLKNGKLPKTFQIVDRDEVKEFLYTQDGAAKLDTALGPLDTVIVTSQRAGGDRKLRMWFAPSLGFVPVQAERTRDGKQEFAMKIKTLKR